MKTVHFNVSLSFHDHIYKDEEIKELAKNIAESLKHTADTCGLAPEDSETFTTKIEVKESLTNTSYKID